MDLTTPVGPWTPTIAINKSPKYRRSEVKGKGYLRIITQNSLLFFILPFIAVKKKKKLSLKENYRVMSLVFIWGHGLPSFFYL